MKHKSFFKSLLMAILLSLPGAVFGQAAQVEKDWSFIKRLDPGLNVMTCVAMTAVAESKIPVQAEIILPETDEKAPLLLIKAKGLAGQVARAYVRPDSKTAYAMLLLSSDAQTGEDTFVLSSMRLQESLKVIAEKSKLDIYFGEGATSILARISLKGSAVTINRAAACRASKQLLNESFFTLLRQSADQVSAQNGSLQEFLIAYQETLTRYNDGLKIKAELTGQQQVTAKLLAQFKAAEQALAVAVRNEQMTLLEIDNLKKKISDLQIALQKANEELPELRAQRPAVAQKLAEAKAAVDPLLPEINRLRSIIDTANSELNSAESQVSYLKNQIASAESQVRTLENQTDQLRADQESKIRQLNDLKSQKNSLENEYRLFDVQRRAQEILRQNFSYDREKRDLERNLDRKQELPREVEIARARMIEAQKAAQVCQAQQPPVDCSQINSQAQTLQREFESKRAELQNLDSLIERNRSRIREYERDADEQARRERDQILQKIKNVSARISEMENNIAEIDRRIRDIQTVEIPRLSRQIDSLRNQLSNAQVQASNAAERVRRAEADLARYKQSVNFDQLNANLKQAQANLKDLDNKIATAEKTQQQAPGQISAAQASLTSQQEELSRRTKLRLDAEVIRDQAQSALQQQTSTEQAIIDSLNKNTEAMLEARTKFQAISKGIFGY